MELALDMVLTFYTSVAEGSKTKAGKFWGLIFTLVKVTGGKLVEDLFGRPPSWIGLNPNQQLIIGIFVSGKSFKCREAKDEIDKIKTME